MIAMGRLSKLRLHELIGLDINQLLDLPNYELEFHVMNAIEQSKIENAEHDKIIRDTSGSGKK